MRTRKTGPAARRPSPRRRLRREIPSTVAVLAAEADFAAMREYPSFAFDDHRVYLDHLQALLRSFAAQGLHTTIARFDPADFRAFCTRRGLDPDRPETRACYTAQMAPLGATIPYGGQPLNHLLPQLLQADGRMRVWERATRRLAALGSCDDCGEDLAKAAFDRAVEAFMRLVEGLGPGAHHLVCSVQDGGLSTAVHTEPAPDGAQTFNETDALDFCTVLAVAFAHNCAGGVVLRSCPAPEAREEVRGWHARHGWLDPLTEAEVFSAYCEDAETGEPIPPEPGVDYRAGYPLEPPAGGCEAGS